MGFGAVVRLAAEKTVLFHLCSVSSTVNGRHVFVDSGSWEPFVQRLLPGLCPIFRRGLRLLLAVRLRTLPCLGV